MSKVESKKQHFTIVLAKIIVRKKLSSVKPGYSVPPLIVQLMPTFVIN